MKFGVVNKSITVNRFVLHTLQRNITHLAAITRKTNIKLGILKGVKWKRAEKCLVHHNLRPKTNVEETNSYLFWKNLSYFCYEFLYLRNVFAPLS